MPHGTFRRWSNTRGDRHRRKATRGQRDSNQLQNKEDLLGEKSHWVLEFDLRFQECEKINLFSMQSSLWCFSIDELEDWSKRLPMADDGSEKASWDIDYYSIIILWVIENQNTLFYHQGLKSILSVPGSVSLNKDKSSRGNFDCLRIIQGREGWMCHDARWGPCQGLHTFRLREPKT